MQRLRAHLKRFARQEGGTITVEFVLVMPLLIWAYLALYVYWDAYRTINLAQKASYTVSDYISRERGSLTAAEITGMENTFKFMTQTESGVKMRITSIYYNTTSKRFEVYWSRSPNSTMEELTTTTLQGYSSHIPAMADGDSAVLVETELDYTPAFNIGLLSDSFANFIVTRPRFLTRICLDGTTC